MTIPSEVRDMAIPLKTSRDIERIRKASRLAVKVIRALSKQIRSGVSTEELDVRAGELIESLGALPAFKGYRGFPCNICTSINEVVVHGIPGRQVLREGDIIGLDIGINLEGCFGDAAVTLPVGRIDGRAKRLLKVTKKALYLGIKEARRGNRLSDISHAIGSFVESQGFSVVREFVGHGVGLAIHEEPAIPNFGEPNQGPRLEPGMIFAIEPMVNMGQPGVEVLKDGWTAVTRDRSLSGHFEHTVLVTEGKPEILTPW